MKKQESRLQSRGIVQTAVSYTHLDVYKRQAINSGNDVKAAETKTGIDEKEAAAYTAGKKETAEQMQTTEMELGSLYFLKLEDYEKSRQHFEAVSYTHLDVYKRQAYDTIVKERENGGGYHYGYGNAGSYTTGGGSYGNSGYGDVYKRQECGHQCRL